jgi:hypothetical protein
MLCWCAFLTRCLLFQMHMQIGETICQKEFPVALPTIQVEEPTVSMTFKVGSGGADTGNASAKRASGEGSVCV